MTDGGVSGGKGPRRRVTRKSPSGGTVGRPFLRGEEAGVRTNYGSFREKSDSTVCEGVWDTR